MIVDDLKRFAREMLVNVVRSLLGGQMPGAPVFTKRFFMQREERRVVAQRAFHPRTTRVALTQVIAHRQQFRGGQLVEGVTLNLF